MLVPITIYHEEIQKLNKLAKVVEIRKSAIVINMFDAIVRVETPEDAQELFVAGKEMTTPKIRA